MHFCYFGLTCILLEIIVDGLGLCTEIHQCIPKQTNYVGPLESMLSFDKFTCWFEIVWS